MMYARARLLFVLILLALALPIGAGPAEAGQQPAPAARPAVQAVTQAPGAPPTPPVVVTEGMDARQTLVQLDDLLNRYPPTLGRVLKLDPTLFDNPAFLAPYPALSAFLTQHPEVARNARYFLANVPGSDGSWTPPDRQSEIIRMWRSMMEGFLIFLVFVLVTATLAWLVKTLIDYRRWHRLSKVQAEVHTKLLDRFATNEDLLAYVQTPAGRRFLESAPISLDPLAPAIGAPLRRILWAVEAGLVLTAGGIGLQFVSGRVIADVGQPLYVVGVLAVSIGIGFVVSAVVSYLLSKRLGLFERSRPANGDRGASASV